MPRVAFFRRGFSILAVLLLTLELAQFFLAGLMLFTLAKGAETKDMLWAAERSSEIFFDLHVFNGIVVIPTVMALLLVFAQASRHPRSTVGLAAALLPLLGLQYLLADQAFAPHQAGSPLLAAFHPLNGLLLLGITLYLAYRHWAFAFPRRAVLVA